MSLFRCNMQLSLSSFVILVAPLSDVLGYNDNADASAELSQCAQLSHLSGCKRCLAVCGRWTAQRYSARPTQSPGLSLVADDDRRDYNNLVYAPALNFRTSGYITTRTALQRRQTHLVVAALSLCNSKQSMTQFEDASVLRCNTFACFTTT